MRPILEIFNKYKYKKSLKIDCIIFEKKETEDNFFSSLKMITTLKEIQLINLRSFQVKDILLNNKDLEKITIKSTSIKENKQKEIIKELITNISSKNLKEITFFQNSLDESIIHLLQLIRENKNLEKLDLGNNKISNEEIKILCEELKKNEKLEMLKIGYNSFNFVALEYIYDLLKENTKIKYLDMSYNKLIKSSSFFKNLSNNQSLRTLMLSYFTDDEKDYEELCNTLKSNKTIKTIKIGRVKLSNEIITAYSEMLKQNETIKELEFTRVPMNDEASSIFSQFFQVNTTLTKLVIDKCDIEIGISYYIPPLSFNNTLKYLDISVNNLGANGALHLKEIIKNNKSIEYLNLTNNYLTEVGAYHISDGLIHNSSIKTLLLNFNELKDEGVESILNSLNQNTSITHLSFQQNLLTKEGGEIISDKINFIPNLKILNLSLNEKLSEGATPIFESLYHNSSLEDLDIKKNGLNNKELKELELILKKNVTLKWVDLSNNPGKNIEKINYYLEANIEWNDKIHFKMNLNFQRAVFIFLLIVKRLPIHFPNEIILMILKKINRKKFFKLKN